MENYAENTVSKLLYLQLEIAGGGESSSASTTSNIDHHQSHLLQADHIASHIGKATGIATLIRSTPHLIQKRLFHLPSQITAKHSLSTEDIFRSVAAGRSDPSSFATTHQALADVVFEVATTANDHLITARTALEKLSGSALIAAPLLNAVPTANYLQRLERANFDIFHPSLHKRDWKLPFKIWRAIRNGKILP